MVNGIIYSYIFKYTKTHGRQRWVELTWPAKYAHQNRIMENEFSILVLKFMESLMDDRVHYLESVVNHLFMVKKGKS